MKIVYSTVFIAKFPFLLLGLHTLAQKLMWKLQNSMTMKHILTSMRELNWIEIHSKMLISGIEFSQWKRTIDIYIYRFSIEKEVIFIRVIKSQTFCCNIVINYNSIWLQIHNELIDKSLNNSKETITFHFIWLLYCFERRKNKILFTVYTYWRLVYFVLFLIFIFFFVFIIPLIIVYKIPKPLITMFFLLMYVCVFAIF